ncbi:MAG: metallophosphoesterase family protein, partial [Lentisphaeraceae bacterium]|nr:metallophosphoesterase family protein [Lentisphaeraceae bacterium]
MKLLASLLILLPLALHSAVDKLRVVWQENPESEATIIWNQISGKNAKVHYDILDRKKNAAAYKKTKAPDRTLNYKGMKNTFTTLKGLKADTNYYFLIKDSEGTSKRYFFRTAPSKKKPFTFIQGGDSRNNRGARQDGNRLVAKLRPLFVSFGGDMTSSGSNGQWQAWLDDWQLSIAADGRIFPIVPIRGNHEKPDSIPNIFGLKNKDSYYKITIADNLFCQYLLNSQSDTAGDQRNWLHADLEANKGKVTFLSASYHKPIRPHVKNKSEGYAVYHAWADLFYNYRFDILAENDSHCVKRTVRVKPSCAPGNDEGFVPDKQGYFLIGEGCWGAPLRAGADNKSWTLDSGAFNSFDLLHVSLDKIEIRTIKFQDE